MRSDLTRSRATYRECGNGSPPCRLAPAQGYNPLGLCPDCLAAYPGGAPVECQACAGAPGQVYQHVAGSMCFACGLSPGGTVATEAHRAQARLKMRARLLVLFREGERGPEWVALLARCPAEMREAFERRLAMVIPQEKIAT